MDLKNNALALLCSLLTLACGQSQNDQKSNSDIMISPLEYDLSYPDKSFKLPKELKEISGMTISGNEQLLAVQDEEGILFTLSLNGKIQNESVFADDDDYEGIAVANGNIYVLRSDGTIFEIKGNPENSAGMDVDLIDTPLDSSYNTEGICFEPHTGALLIACKENAADSGEDVRHIFRFYPENRKFEKEPAYSIRHSTLKTYLKELKGNDREELKPLMEELGDELFIYPSDIALHPVSGDLYIISARDPNCLLVMNREGQIKSIGLLPEILMEQPEGICFDNEGNLFISSEGKPKEDRLFYYKQKK